MRTLEESDLILGEDVIVTDEKNALHAHIGEIWKINKYTSPPTVSVSFEGEIYRFALSDLSLA